MLVSTITGKRLRKARPTQLAWFRPTFSGHEPALPVPSAGGGLGAPGAGAKAEALLSPELGGGRLHPAGPGSGLTSLERWKE